MYVSYLWILYKIQVSNIPLQNRQNSLVVRPVGFFRRRNILLIRRASNEYPQLY